MAASANPSGGGGHNNSNNNNGNNNSNSQEGTSNNANGAASNGLAVPDNSVVGPTRSALRHNPGLSAEWTPEEQSRLEDLLAKYSSESNVVRYAKIAMQLHDKTVRDVALRCRWMSSIILRSFATRVFEKRKRLKFSSIMNDFKDEFWKKENGKRRKDDNNSARKNKDKKEKATDSVPKSHVVNRTNGPPYAQSVMSMDSDDGISYKAIGGPTGQLLEQSAQALDQISANFAACKIHENINLFCQARNNILSILNDLNDMPEIMKQMPPLPVKLNEDLANSILPRASVPKKC